MGKKITDIQCFEKWVGAKYVNTKNNRILKEVAASLEGINTSRHSRANITIFINSYIRSLGPFINTINDHVGYNETTLFYQIDYILQYNRITEAERYQQLWLLIRFYNFICLRYPEMGYFNDAVRMSYKLLKNIWLPQYILNGWTFLNYSPLMKYEGQERVILTLHGFDRHSTRMSSREYIALHLYKIDSPFFRELFIDYITSSYTRLSEFTDNHLGTIGEIMKTLCRLKTSRISNVSSINHWTVQDARLIKKLVNVTKTKKQNGDLSLRTKNNLLGFIRRWFQWAADNGRMSFEKLFFDELSQFEEPTKKDARPIPPEHLQLIFDKAHVLSMQNNLNRVLYLSMKLLHQTNFRPSDIYSMTISGLDYSISHGSHIIRHITKTSGPFGQIDPLTKFDYDILKEVIELTDELRENAPDKSMKDLIFLFRMPNGRISNINNDKLRYFMECVCKELGIKRYTPYNIRYTYMTKVFENAVINDLSESEVQVLTKHVNLGTTMGYVKKSRADYFKALYQVMLEDVQVDPRGKVVERMPDQAQDLSEREGGCGKCRATNCIFQSILPCITCENFVTTIEYEPFFKRMIAHIDDQMEDATYPHDREDLVTMKEVYVSFLIEIDKLKSQTYHE